jgi:hypothetical protein
MWFIFFRKNFILRKKNILQLIQEEKTKHFKTSEKKPFRFVEKIEIINPIKQLQTTPIQTEVTLQF